MVPDNRPRPNARPHRIGPLIVLGLLMVLMAGGGIYLATRPDEPPEEPAGPPQSFEPPKLTETRFLNTGEDAVYVGNQSCAECHAEQFASYQLTAHSRALSPVDPAVEPAAGEFTHRLSHRKYEIYRQDDKFRQREYVEDAEGTIAEQDFAMDWLIGSGRHSRSYLVNIEDFLVESPVTWYSSRREWDLSPGYDHPKHWGFERAADEGCLFCHVGLARPEGDSLSRLVIQQDAISCERCHGPGSVHVARRRDGNGQPGDMTQGDPSIVHPGRLDRLRAEDVCAQCHLRGDATVLVRGRRLTDYRPGLPLTDVRIDYQLQAENRPMKVVGHVEQMRLSRCWQADGSTLTCTTCHDPHQDAPPEDKIAFYREKCLSCHAPDACALPTDAPRRVQAGDDCNRCHMPKVETDIPHIAFTHHHIGLHEADLAPRVEPREAQLVPATPIDHLPEVDRIRSLGLAYLELAEKQASQDATDVFHRRAWQLLSHVREMGLFDGDTEAGLARILWEQKPEDALPPAHAALHAQTLSPQARINALFILADAAFRNDDLEMALESLEELTTLRRHSEDHFLLAVCLSELGRHAEAIEHGEKAVEIHPFRIETYQLLAELSEKAERPEDAARYASLAQRFAQVQQPARQSDSREGAAPKEQNQGTSP